MTNKIRVKYAWIKANRKFCCKRNTKRSFARDLIFMKQIRLSKKDCEYLDIRNTSFDELKRVQLHEWSMLLEYKGWKWVRYYE